MIDDWWWLVIMISMLSKFWSWACAQRVNSSQLQLRSGLEILGSSQLQLRSGLEILGSWSVVGFQKLRKTAPRIFLVFCMKLGDQKVRKITRPDFRKKISILRFLAFYGQNGLKSDSLSIYSKMVPPILLILHIQID